MKSKMGVFSVLLLFAFVVSCKQPVSPGSNNTASSNTEAKKLALYQDMKGLWQGFSSYRYIGEFKEAYKKYINETQKCFFTYEECVTYEQLQKEEPLAEKLFKRMIAEKSTEHTIDWYKDCLFTYTVTGEGAGPITPAGREVLKNFEGFVYKRDGNKLYRQNWKCGNLFDFYAQLYDIYTYYQVDITADNSSGGGGSSVTLSGNYEIKEANGSTFKMTGGNWTFTYKGQTKNGTYTQSGNELTINYSQGHLNVSAVFTVSESGGIITLTKKSGDATTIISSVFMVTDSNAVSNGVVKLAAK